MSKKKDREDINYRNCPVCGSKAIIVYIKKLFKRTYVYCRMCNENIRVKKVYRKENIDYLEVQDFYKKIYRKRACRRWE